MKRLFSILLLMFATTLVFGQEQEQKRKRANFSPEQLAELQTKKMALALELTDNQQEQIFELNKRKATLRKEKIAEIKALKAANKELSSDEIFALKKAQLDARLEHQSEMKNILNEQQFETWKKARNRHAYKAKRKMAKRRAFKKRMRFKKAQERN